MKSKVSNYIHLYKNDVPFLNDPSNDDNKYIRNLIRHEILHQALKVNPGLFKVLKKKYDKI
jgi:tRNA(Ile)-lysidine synthase TilS/MesJ